MIAAVRGRPFFLSNAFPVILLMGLFGMTARNATDPDLWWHLRTGQWIVDTSQVPHSDPFSFTRAGHPWVSHEWLSEVLFYQLWKHGGAAALIVSSAIVTTAGFMLLYLRCLRYGQKTYWAVAVIAFGALASAPCWGVRPQMFTFTLASLLLWLIEAGERRSALLLWIPPLFLLWLNLHGGFALGPALLFAYGIGLLMETATGKTPWQEARPILLRVLLLLIVCLGLVPLNPSGAQLYRYPFDTLRSPGMRSFIVEWFSPDFHQSLYQPLLLLWLLLLTLLASSRRRSPYTNFCFGGGPSDCRGASSCIAVASRAKTPKVPLPASFRRHGSNPDGWVCIGEVDHSRPSPECPRGRAVSSIGDCLLAGHRLAGQRPAAQGFCLLRLGRLCDLEALSRISRIRGWSGGPLRR
jgi:hypothetical protein